MPERVSGKVMYYVMDSLASQTAEFYVGDEYVGLVQRLGMKKFVADEGEELIIIYNISTERYIRKAAAKDGMVWHIE
jgi:hypothetical protein